MHRKKAQITIFIIIGVILIVISGFLIAMVMDKDVPLEQIQGYNTVALENHISDCLDSTTRDAIYFISQQGGYHDVPNPKTSKSYFSIPYYYQSNVKHIPIYTELTESIERYVDEHIDDCLDLDFFRNKGVKIETEQQFTSITGNNVSLFVQLNYPMHIYIDEDETILSDFSVSVPTDMLKLRSVAEDYIDYQSEQPKYIRTSYLASLCNKNNMFAELIEGEDGTIVFQLIQPKPHNIFADYAYLYAIDYELIDIPKKPMINEIPDMDISIGYGYEYEVTATDENIRFKDNSYLFDIDPNTGVIQFIPQYSDSGRHVITISDANDVADPVTFVLSIENFGESPEVENIGYLNAEVGVPFEYQIQAESPEGHTLRYLSDSLVFTVDPVTGLLAFTPAAWQVGTHRFNVRVIDQLGHSTTTSGVLKIID